MKIFRKIRLAADRSFSSARFRQIFWLVGILLLFFGIFYLLNHWFNNMITRPSRILELMMDPGVFSSPLEGVEEGETQEFWRRMFEFVISIFGAVFFTGVLISIISNMLEERVTAFKKGLIRYKFNDHILILGANEMLANMIKSFSSQSKFSGKDIVVLTDTSVEDLYERLYSELDKSEMKRLVLLFGSRDSEDVLKQVRVQYANRVYIIGENNEVQHDAKNISCWEKIERLCANRITDPMKCYMVINNQTSFHVFQFETKVKDEKNSSLKMTIINSMENWAQQVLVTRRYNNLEYPAIDRNGIDKDSKKRVHFVVVGMTPMALAMATTAAHIAHYPNFKEGDAKTRTKITFVSANIEQEMNFLKSHYSSLFALSNSRYVYWENGEMKVTVETPKEGYGDFLDVEWEFVNGGIETPEVRSLLAQWCEEKDDYMTMAICDEELTANTAVPLYLPNEVYIHQIPVFAYQPAMGKVLEQAHSTIRYKNVYPFGMEHDCYDAYLRDRLSKAKRINYLYKHIDDAEKLTDNSSELDELWFGLIFAHQLSNVYSANSIPGKFRSIGLHLDANGNLSVQRDLTKEETEILAKTEHNRWNVEKLLVGYHAMTPEQRAALTPLELKEKKNKYFAHADIRPYDELSEGTKKYDRNIAEHLTEL